MDIISLDVQTPPVGNAYGVFNPCRSNSWACKDFWSKWLVSIDFSFAHESHWAWKMCFWVWWRSLCKSKCDERVSQGQKILDALVVLHDASCLFLAFTEITIPVSHSGCARLPCRCVRRGYSTFAGVNRPDIAFRVVARSSCQKKKCAKSSQLRYCISNACDICSRFFLCNFYSFLYFNLSYVLETKRLELRERQEAAARNPCEQSLRHRHCTCYLSPFAAQESWQVE